MADDSSFFLVEIITPDGIFYRGEATMIEFHTIAGELGVYKNHIPLTTVLSPGDVRIHGGKEADIRSQKKNENPPGSLAAAVHSGFVEILRDKVTMLAESAEWS